MPPIQRQLLVLYGSQSGCAQEVAERVDRESRVYKFHTRLMCMDDYPVTQLPQETFVVYVASTTGHGECPDNMKSFWRFLLRKSLSATSLCRQYMAVFGLGDSSYPIYNAVARRLFQRLLNLGARPICPRGLGDDQHDLGLDAGLDPWLHLLWTSVAGVFPVVEPVHTSALAPARCTVHIVDDAVPPEAPLPSFGHGPNAYTPFPARLLSIRRISSPVHDQDIRHLEFDLSGSGISYEPGDVLIVHCKNNAEQVRIFVEDALGLSLDTVVSIAGSADLPNLVSLRDLCTRWIDIQSTPKRYFFQVLAHFAQDELHKERLQELSSAEGVADLYSYNHRERRTFAEVLLDFPSARLPLEYLLEVIPRLKPRQFSISSSPLAHPNQVHITAAIVEYQTPYKRHKVGTCSQFFQSLRPEQGVVRVPIWSRKGSFRLPNEPSPLILVGPGTGVAPFRSMLHQLHHQASQCPLPFVALFYGCRYSAHDYLYQDEWKHFVESGSLSLFVTAFSRDQPHKVYVQHRLLEHGDNIFSLLDNGNAIFMVAGNSKRMPADVRHALSSIIQKHGHMSEELAEAYLKKLQVQNRYILECWA